MSSASSAPDPIVVLNAPAPRSPPCEPATFLTPDQMQWRKIIPTLGEGSPKLAVVRHDPHSGATAMLIWTPPDFHVPRHWHTGSEKHMLVRGKFIMECEGKEVIMTPGTFNFLPARTIHQAWTPPDSDCLLFTDIDALWDIHWLDPPPGS
ncbi:MAG TPA: cupin domain-containing protein [Tepidisphaeraceae bacterium]|nr:cupin domain-containing protein [Tepidisphaeraceae bacterium]